MASRDRDEEITRLLNSNAVLSADSGDRWRQLINDYFLAPGPDQETNESDSDSSGDTSDSEGPELSDNVTGDEETERDGEPLFLTDPTSDLLQSVQGEYASVGGDLEKAREFVCGCKINKGQACCTLFTPEEMVKRRDQVQEMTTGKHLSTSLS